MAPNAVRTGKIPYEVVFGVVSRLDHLRVFGSCGFAHVEAANRSKLDAKSFKCVLIRCAEAAKAYRVIDLDSGNVKLSRSLLIDEREVDSIYTIAGGNVAGHCVTVGGDIREGRHSAGCS